MAAIPPTETCMNCHQRVRTTSVKLEPIRQSAATGEPVEWIKVHDLPDYVYFNHSAHVTRGIGCVSCHGRIDQMEVVYQAKELSMAWCIKCHRNPDPHLREVENVTKLDWEPPADWDQEAFAKRVREEKHINPQVHCAVCHR